MNDRNYLDSLTGAGSELRNPRNNRIVRDRLSAHCPSVPSGEFHYGYDPAGHLVASTTLDPVRCGADFAVMAVLWPHEAPARGLPDNARLVGDARSGDRPVYVRYSDSELDLLPWKPGEDRGWNFGYSGTTAGNLALAIIGAYAMTHQIPTNRIPYHCVYQAVTHFRGAGLMLTAGDITRHVH